MDLHLRNTLHIKKLYSFLYFAWFYDELWNSIQHREIIGCIDTLPFAHKFVISELNLVVWDQFRLELRKLPTFIVTKWLSNLYRKRALKKNYKLQHLHLHQKYITPHMKYSYQLYNKNHQLFHFTVIYILLWKCRIISMRFFFRFLWCNRCILKLSKTLNRGKILYSSTDSITVSFTFYPLTTLTGVDLKFCVSYLNALTLMGLNKTSNQIELKFIEIEKILSYTHTDLEFVENLKQMNDAERVNFFPTSKGLGNVAPYPILSLLLSPHSSSRLTKPD